MSGFLHHGPCAACGSSDGLATYADGGTHCFVCHHHTNFPSPTTHTRKPKHLSGALLTDLRFEALPKRRLSEETCRHWKYGKAEHHGEAVQVATYCSPDGTPVAQKLRGKGKQFSVLGNLKKAGLYGQHLWRDGGRMVVVTEGELDALSMSQLQDHKWPVVSIPAGAAAAASAIKKSLEWLQGFETVCFMFDNDEPGQTAALECAALLTPGKAKIATLPLKDVSDMLQANRGKEVISAMWGARTYRPDGILADEEVWARLVATDTTVSLPFPWAELTEKTRGLRSGEITLFCAGSGTGKSLACREIAANLIGLGEKVGYIALEESVRRTAFGLLAVAAGKPLHLDSALVTEEELKVLFNEMIANKAVFYDHFGSLESETLLSKIRYMSRALDCKWVVLDHISIVVSGDEQDERRNLDLTMTRLRSLVQETGIGLILVSHLKRPDKAGHEDGALTSLSQLRGSASLGQLSDTVIGLERDQQDEENRDTTNLRVLKCRHTGDTGLAGTLKYDRITGRLTEASAALEEIFA